MDWKVTFTPAIGDRAPHTEKLRASMVGGTYGAE